MATAIDIPSGETAGCIAPRWTVTVCTVTCWAVVAAAAAGPVGLATRTAIKSERRIIKPPTRRATYSFANCTGRESSRGHVLCCLMSHAKADGAYATGQH